MSTEENVDFGWLCVHQQRVGRALTNFESEVSLWLRPSEWLESNTTNIHSIVEDIDIDVLPRTYFETVIFQPPGTVIYEVCEYIFRVSDA